MLKALFWFVVGPAIGAVIGITARHIIDRRRRARLAQRAGGKPK